MARKKRTPNLLPTIWRVPDELSERIEPILNELDPPARTGRKRIAPRRALDGIIYQMRTGCQWSVLPREFGDDSSVHRIFQRWIGEGVLGRIWATLVDECEELDGVDWQCQAADGAMGKARLGRPQLALTPRIAAKTAQDAAS